MPVTTIELWSARRVAEELGVSRRAVWRYAESGVLPDCVPVEGENRSLVWRADDIRQFIRKGGVK